MNRAYRVDDLMERYGISRVAVIKFLTKYLDRINEGDVHVKKVGREWVIDDEAVKLMDEIRNHGVTPVDVAREADAYTSILEENHNLQVALHAMRDKYEAKQEELTAAIKALAEAKQPAMLLEANYERAKSDLEAANAKLNEVNLVNSQLIRDTETAKGQVEADKTIISEKEKRIEELTEQVNSVNSEREATLAQVATLTTSLNAAEAKASAAEQAKQAAAEASNAELAALRLELEAEKKKSWWQKLFGG